MPIFTYNQAYSSLAQGALLDNAEVISVCEGLGCTPAQVTIPCHIQIAACGRFSYVCLKACLSWALSKGYAVLPRSADPARISENATAATLHCRQVAPLPVPVQAVFPLTHVAAAALTEPCCVAWTLLGQRRESFAGIRVRCSRSF